MKVRFARPAEQDLEAIGDWIGERDALAALRMVLRIRRAANRLSRYPRRFPVVEECTRAEIRKLLVRKYLIFYRVGEEEVEIVRVVHASTDWVTLFG